MFRGQNLRALGVNTPVAHSDLVYLIHEFRDQIEAKAGAAETRDLTLRCQYYARVLDGVLKIIFSHSWGCHYRLSSGIREWNCATGGLSSNMPSMNRFRCKDCE